MVFLFVSILFKSSLILNQFPESQSSIYLVQDIMKIALLYTTESIMMHNSLWSSSMCLNMRQKFSLGLGTKSPLQMALLLAVVLNLMACATFSKANEQNLYQVHLGQTKADLLTAMGTPSRQAVDGSSEKRYYEVYSFDYRQIYPYTATFENDKLVHWDFDTRRTSENVRARESRNPSSMGVRY